MSRDFRIRKMRFNRGRPRNYPQSDWSTSLLIWSNERKEAHNSLPRARVSQWSAHACSSTVRKLCMHEFEFSRLCRPIDRVYIYAYVYNPLVICPSCYTRALIDFTIFPNGIFPLSFGGLLRRYFICDCSTAIMRWINRAMESRVSLYFPARAIFRCLYSDQKREKDEEKDFLPRASVEWILIRNFYSMILMRALVRRSSLSLFIGIITVKYESEKIS